MAKGRQPAPEVPSGADARLVALGEELRRAIRRAQRQRRRADSTAWSNTVDHAVKLADQISAAPAAGLKGLAVKLWAVTWFLDETDAVLDHKGLRQLRALDRELRRLVEN